MNSFAVSSEQWAAKTKSASQWAVSSEQ